ncbi:succinate dehydrogenase, cytochrome b556 subunit [Pararoseomonas indoligenes]|uniref:Succinate dehydrogenase cytochrome b556 subunit n=1 Tax=Roseomonas indoligenes TaxID=2820811 RepID=A0A940MTV4_9PROT|nr:succinate dehydrogenase, cytochrome b556 subunit [Pararoseomonas indoligenes]MBP0491588.1 succinate dehydrogenase, cytochrome b556 subunit [Pararoseomonas indoligenes]
MAHNPDAREALMIGTRTDGSTVRRPLSPHLQVYDMLQMSSLTSIMHRITGSIWSVGMIFFVWWLSAAAAGPEAYATVQWFFGGFIGLIMLFGLSAVVWYHTLNGVRHLVWDAGYGYDIPTTYRTGWATAIATAVMTVVTWIVAIIAWAS